MKDSESRSPEASLIPRLLLRLVDAVCRRPRLVLALSLLACLVSVVAAATRLEYHTHRNDLINPNKDYHKRWRQYLAEFGDDDDIVAVVKGDDPERMRQALEALAGRVREQPATFDRLFYKADLQALRRRALLFLPTPEIQAIQENLRSMGLLLEFGPVSWRSLSLLSLLREGNHRAGQWRPGEALSASDDQFFTQLTRISQSAAATLHDPNAYRNPWGSLLAQPPGQKDLLAEPQYFFSGDNTLAFLLVRPVKEAGSFTAAQKSVVAMRDVVARTRGDFRDVEFGLTGLPVLETDEMTAAQRDTGRASWLAIVGVTLLFIVVYRGIYYPALTVVTLVVGTVWAMGWLTLTVGHLNILSATFAVMLIGMGDYGVLWVMRYEAARRQGYDVSAALRHTAVHVAVGNLTAAATLSLAFFAAMLADFQAVVELGWIAGCGVLLCAFACFTVLPAILMLFDRRGDLATKDGWRVVDEEGEGRPTPEAGARTEASWRPWFAGRPRGVLAVGALVTLLLAFVAARIGYDHNLLHMQAKDLDSVKWEMTLIEHTAGASWHALSYTDTPEEALALKARYEQLPEVSRVVEIAALVPRDQPRKMEMMQAIQHRLRKLPARGSLIAHASPNRADLDDELTALRDKLASAPPSLAELRKHVTSLQGHLAAIPEKAVAEERLRDFDQHLAGDLAEDLHRLREVSTPEPITLADLPPELRERYVGANGKWLLRVFAKDCLWDFGPLEHFTKQIQTIDPAATGKVFTTVEGLKAMKEGFQRAGLYALFAIVLVLVADFRNPKRVLLALAPLVMGIAAALGLMALGGFSLNPANMIAVPLILGVGVDNGVHLLHDYLLRRRAGHADVSYPIGRGVLVKALTTMIGFGTLMISSQRGLASLGLILTLGVGCCMAASLVFLPALLHQWDRRKERIAQGRATIARFRPAA